MTVYFDNSATTKPFREVIDVMIDIMENNYANSSSIHRLGLKAYEELQKSRRVLGKVINCSEDEIIFTSGGSESNNFILNSMAKPGAHIITTEIEHASIIESCRFLEEAGVKLTYLPVDSLGNINLEELEKSINKETVLVSIMHVNNEIGSLQNLKEISSIIKSRSSRAKFHVDAVQSFGKLSINVKDLNIDFLSASAHKIHGPKGIGLCYIKKNIHPKPLIHGGAQESGLRAGTVNVPAASGFAVAAGIMHKNIDSNYNKVWGIKEYFIEKLKEVPEAKVNSPLKESFSPYILNVQFKDVRGEILLRMLEDKEIYASAGAACSSKSSKDSHVLKALGLNHEDVLSSLRFSFNPYNTTQEVDIVIEELKKSLIFLRRMKK